LHEFNESLVEAIMQNAQHYSNLFSEVIFELLPRYKQRNEIAKDALDEYIEHRLSIDSSAPARDSKNRLPLELMKRL